MYQHDTHWSWPARPHAHNEKHAGSAYPADDLPQQTPYLLPGRVPARDICRCQGAGWLRQDVPYGHPHFGKLVECVCLLERRRVQRQQELLQLSGLSHAQRSQTLATFAPHVKGVQQAFLTVTRFVQTLRNRSEVGQEPTGEHPGWLVLMGPVGVGKTHLATAAANAAMDANRVVLFATVVDLLDHLRATYAPTSELVYDELVARIRSADLLVLDDLGTQRSTPWADEKLFQLLNHRSQHRLPTVITMNEKAWPHLDERLQSRLSDVQLVQVIRMHDAQDYRRLGKQEEMPCVRIMP